MNKIQEMLSLDVFLETVSTLFIVYNDKQDYSLEKKMLLITVSLETVFPKCSKQLADLSAVDTGTFLWCYLEG